MFNLFHRPLHETFNYLQKLGTRLKTLTNKEFSRIPILKFLFCGPISTSNRYSLLLIINEMRFCKRGKELVDE